MGLTDPAGLEVHDIRPIRDDIERRVLDLLAELGAQRRATQDGASTSPGTA